MLILHYTLGLYLCKSTKKNPNIKRFTQIYTLFNRFNQQRKSDNGKDNGKDAWEKKYISLIDYTPMLF